MLGRDEEVKLTVDAMEDADTQSLSIPRGTYSDEQTKDGLYQVTAEDSVCRDLIPCRFCSEEGI